MRDELRAFCDYLYKPIVQVVQQSKEDAANFSKFVLEIYFPGFVPKRSDMTFSLLGRNAGTPVLLSTNSAENKWNPNQLEGKMVTEGVIQLTVDERLLEAQPITLYGHSVQPTQTKGMNYHRYNMALQYKHPAGIPITLDYPDITIDDGFSFMLWRHHTEINDFAMEQAHNE